MEIAEVAERLARVRIPFFVKYPDKNRFLIRIYRAVDNEQLAVLVECGAEMFENGHVKGFNIEGEL